MGRRAKDRRLPRASQPPRLWVSPIDRYQAARTLPEGHVERREAAAAVREEYAECSAQEALFMKRLPRKYRMFRRLQGDLPRSISSAICAAIGSAPPKRVILASPAVRPGACAHYGRGEIHSRYPWISLDTLVHELAHHVGGSGHGRLFCEVESLLFEAVPEVLDFSGHADEDPYTVPMSKHPSLRSMMTTEALRARLVNARNEWLWCVDPAEKALLAKSIQRLEAELASR